MESLLLILETRKIRIYRRKTFHDKYEGSLDLRKQFALQVAGDSVSKEANQYLLDNAEDLSIKSQQHTIYSYLPTICWTTEHKENSLMWDAYTTKYGVRIHSSVNYFLKSISPFENYFYHDEIKYSSDSPYSTAEDLLFIKHQAFSDEREYRFYFYEDSNALGHSKCISKRDYIELPINPKILIEKAILSPKLTPLFTKKLIEYFESEYGIKATKSVIYP